MSMKKTGQSTSKFLPSILRSPALLFLVWAGWLAASYLLFGANSFCPWHDNADSFVALAQTNHLGSGSGGAGWWNPQMASGQDAVSSLQLPVLVKWLFIPMPGWLAYGLIMACQRFLAGYFLYRLLREELDLVPWAAVYGGLMYAFFSQRGIDACWQGYDLWHGFALPGIPATIWALARIDRQRTPVRFVAAAGLGAVIAMGMIFPFAIFCFIGYFVWFAAVKPRKEFGFWALFVVFSIGWFVTNALPIWASMLNAPLSQRADWHTGLDAWGDNEDKYFRDFVSLLVDNLPSIVLLSLGLVFTRLRDQRLIVLAAVMAAILLYAAFYPWVQRTVIPHLGFLSSFDWSRVCFVLPFLCATAGAVALPSILGAGEIHLIWRKQTAWVLPMAQCVGLFAILLAVERSVVVQITVVRNLLAGENQSNYYLNPELLALARDYRDAPPFRVATVCPLFKTYIYPDMLWAYGLPTADGIFQMYSKRYHRFWGRVIQNLTKINPSLRHHFENYGCRAYLFWPGPIEPEAKPTRFRDLYNLDLLSLANVRFLVSPVPLADDDLRLVLSGSEGSSDVSGPEAGDGRKFARLRRFLKDGLKPLKLFIYENRKVIPRVFVAHRTRFFEQREQLLSALTNATREELASTAFLLQDEANAIDPVQTSGANDNDTARIVVNQADKIVVSVTDSRPGILVVTQNYSPFWKVRVDGAEGRVIPVDHTFQGVRLEPGQHEVELAYRPPYALY
jgi:hypothetical protein